MKIVGGHLWALLMGFEEKAEAHSSLLPPLG